MSIDPNDVDLVIYHAFCSDGTAAGYAAWKLLGNRATYVAAQHGDPPPDVRGKNVAILDFSYDNKTTKQMIKDASSFVILDHHKSAQAELHDIAEARFDMNHSGCVLSWKFFHPGEEVPKFIKYIEDRDLWTFSLPYSKEFSAAFDMVLLDFASFEIFEDDSAVDDAIYRGKYILSYSKTVLKKIAGGAVHRKLDGKDVMVVNSAHWMSEIGNILAHDCDYSLIWRFNHERKETHVSLRAFHDDIDVSAVAKRFGGGGHKKSSGFFLPWGVHIEDIFDKEN